MLIKQGWAHHCNFMTEECRTHLVARWPVFPDGKHVVVELHTIFLAIQSAAYSKNKGRRPLNVIQKTSSTYIIKSCSEMLEKPCEIFGGEKWRKSLRQSYSEIARIYGLPKIHKEGNKYKPISDNTLTYTYRLSKWLCARFLTLKQFDRFSVKNSVELTDRLRDVKLADDEILVSFDISSYFTSVPVDKALDCLQIWLDKQLLDHIKDVNEPEPFVQ